LLQGHGFMLEALGECCGTCHLAVGRRHGLADRGDLATLQQGLLERHGRIIRLNLL